MAWFTTPPRAGGLIFPRAGAATLESAALQPFTLSIEHPLNRLTAGRTAILGLVPARLGRRVVTPRSLADRSRRKNFCCVTTRRRNFGIFRRLRRRWGSLAARSLGLGVPGLDGLILAPPGLSFGCLPTPDQPQALGVLAVMLVPTPRRVLAPTALAKTEPCSRTSAAIWLMMMAAHGRSLSQGTARGGTR